MSKKIRILTLVNTLQSVSPFIYANHIEIFTKAKSKHPEISFELYTPARMSIDNARNTAAKMALYYQYDYLMFLDDDVMAPGDTFERLIKADKDVIAGLVIIRGMPFNVMAFKFTDAAKKSLGYFNQIPLVSPCEKEHDKYELECESCREKDIAAIRKGIRHGNLVEHAQCDAVGFSTCLIKTDVLQPLEPPYFVTGPNHTEDVYFCMKLRELSPIPEIFIDNGTRCGHLLNPEPIEFATRKKMHDFYLEEWTALNNASKGRDLAHLRRCMAALGVEPKMEERPLPGGIETGADVPQVAII